MDLSKDSFRKMFPNLYREMKSGDHSKKVDSVRLNVEEGEKEAELSLRGYDPNVIDFIRRCDELEEAEQIIIYMKSSGEIDEDYADELLRRLREKGLRSFGPKKEDGYYFRIAGLK